jgi:hypothetical protein
MVGLKRCIDYHIVGQFQQYLKTRLKKFNNKSVPIKGIPNAVQMIVMMRKTPIV